MPDFKLNQAYTPTADQPKAISALAEGLEEKAKEYRDIGSRAPDRVSVA